MRNLGKILLDVGITTPSLYMYLNNFQSIITVLTGILTFTLICIRLYKAIKQLKK